MVAVSWRLMEAAGTFWQINGKMKNESCRMAVANQWVTRLVGAVRGWKEIN